MSFVRFGSDSDVYVYLSDDTLNFVCSSCVLTDKSQNDFHDDFECERISEMLKHLDDHRKNGNDVPENAYWNLAKRQLAMGDDCIVEKKKRMRYGNWQY